MKKNKLLIISTSFALGIGLIGAGVGVALHQKEASNKIMEDATLPDDNIGARVKLAAENEDPLEDAPTFVNTLGYRVIDEESGAKSVRVYAVTTGYKGLNGVSVTRKVTDSTGASVMAEKTIQFGYLYSSIKDADLVSWDEDLPEETETTKNYFMVFTLKNIPESHWFDTISVKFSLDNGAFVNSNEALANVKGLMPKEEGVGVTIAQADSGVIYAVKTSSSITEAVVPEDYCTYSGHVATFVGKVTRLGNPKSKMDGAFENCGSLTSVTLPDTIAEMGGWTFSNCDKLTSIRLPRDLKTVNSSCWTNMSIKTIYYDAVDFTNSEKITFNAKTLKEVVISSDVEALPNNFIYSTVSLEKVTYKGTIAAFEALKTDENANNGLFIDNVFATDNVVKVTFHLPEGVTLDDETGEVQKDFLTGKVAKFGTPLKTGHKFDGWYTDEALSTPLDTSLPISAAMDLYPKFSEFGDGISEAKPIILGEENATFTETLVPGYEEVYFKYTVPSDAAAGWRYVRINKANSVTDKDLSVGVSDLGNQKLFFYKDSVSDDNAIAESTSIALTDTAKVQRLYGDDGFKRVYVEPGQTYIIVADAYYSTYYPDRHWYGDLAIEWSKAEHDSIDTAVSIAFDEEKEIAPTYKGEPLSLYKFAPTETKTLSVYVNSSGNFNASVDVYDVTDAASVKSLGSINYKYVSGGTGITTNNKAFDFEAGHTYILAPASSEAATDAKYASFKIGDLPAGTSVSKPIAYTFGETVKVEQVSGNDVYYSFALESEQTVQFSVTGGSSYSAKYLKLLSMEGTEIADAGNEVPETERGWYGDDEEYYGRIPLTINTKLAAGTYVIKTGYVSANSFTPFNLSSKVILPGETIDDPITAEVSDEGVASMNATTSGTYYKVVATAAGYMQFNVTSTNGTLSLMNSAGKVVSTAGNGGFFYTTVAEGDELIVKAAGADETISVTITYPASIQDGKTIGTAYVLDFSESETTDVTYASESSSTTSFFKFSVATTGTYRIYTNNASIDTKLNGIYEESDTSNKITGTYTDDDYQSHAPFTNYRFDTYNEVPLEAGKTYYMSLYIGGNSSNVTIKAGLSLMSQGDAATDPLAKSWSGDTMSLEATNGIKYYSFTSDVAGTYDLAVTSSNESVTPTVNVYSNGKVLSSEVSGKLRYTFETGKEYVLEVKTSESVDVTITRTAHIGVFTGSGLQGLYIGAMNGSSYYKVEIGDDLVKYETQSGYEPDGDIVTNDGISSFVANGKTYYTNGTDMIGYQYSGSASFYFFTKRQTTYSGDTVNGKMAKTKDATISSGIVIQSVCIDDGSRIYSVIKDGTIYFDATVEFASSEESDIKTSTSGFTVKDSSGNVIGTFTSASGTLTEVTSPAA